jgi:hypothetical protein
MSIISVLFASFLWLRVSRRRIGTLSQTSPECRLMGHFLLLQAHAHTQEVHSLFVLHLPSGLHGTMAKLAGNLDTTGQYSHETLLIRKVLCVRQAKSPQR